MLRSIGMDDLVEIYDLYGDGRLSRLNAWSPLESSGQAKAKIQLFHDQFARQERVRWGIFLRERPQELVGDVAWVRFDHRFMRAEVGYNLRMKYHGLGIMTEAVRANLHYGFSHFSIRAYQAMVLPENMPSIRLLERLGFVQEGVVRKAALFEGELVDIFQYSCLEAELI